MTSNTSQLGPLYLITDGGPLRSENRLVSSIEEALIGADGAVGVVQLREQVHGGAFPCASDEQLIYLCRELVPICSRYKAQLLINSRFDLVLETGSQGVHLGARSKPLAEVRGLLGEGFLIGYSAHSLEEAFCAAKQGADYVLYSPVFPPLSKESSRAAVGLKGLSAVVQELPVAVYALGGITVENCAECRDVGAHGVAMISSVLKAASPRDAASRVAKAWNC